MTARSRPSSRSAEREVEARRTERTHGWASPWETSSHRSRTVVSTRARCTWWAAGIDERAALTTS